MTQRKRKNIAKQNEKKRKEGRGQGEGKNYKPWITVRDFGSRGLKTRIKGIKTGRTHHLLSKLELQAFFCFDWCQTVTDIKEQYPLDLKETLAISQLLIIKHPKIPATNEASVMTTDFLVSIWDGFEVTKIAINTKYAKELNRKRVIEKLEIERDYWKRRNIKWHILTNNDINLTLVRNIEWIHSYFNPIWLLNEISNNTISQVEDFLTHQLISHNLTISSATKLSDKYFNFLQA